MNVTIVEEWVDDTDYSGLIFCQTTVKYVSSPIKGPCKSVLKGHEEDAKYHHTLSCSGGRISPTWTLIENHSTVDVFSKKNLLQSIRRANHDLAIFLTGGNTATNLVGDLPGNGTGEIEKISCSPR